MISPVSAVSIGVKIKLLSDLGNVPEYAKQGDGACDLKSAVDVIIPPLGRELVGTGVSVAIPLGYGGLVLPRSGLAINHGITCLNAPGLIDSGYRGEIKVILYNSDSDNEFYIHIGDRIAQLVVVALPSIDFEPVNELSNSDRGVGGFGHTGI